jgi:hypothetical protein
MQDNKTALIMLCYSIKSFIIFVLVGLLAACAAKNYYQEPVASPNVAYLKSEANQGVLFKGLLAGAALGFMSFYDIHIHSLDGKPISSSSVRITPGKHTVNLTCVINYSYNCGENTVTFYAKSGHTYLATTEKLSASEVDLTAGNKAYIKDVTGQ